MEKVKQVLTEKLNLADSPDIERAHRVGRIVDVLEDTLVQLSADFVTGGKRI